MIESYVRVAGLRGSFKYGKYDVTVEKDGKVQNTVTVKAWNKTNAVERVVKQVGTDGLIFSVDKGE